MLYFSVGDFEYVLAAPFDALQCMCFFKIVQRWKKIPRRNILYSFQWYNADILND